MSNLGTERPQQVFPKLNEGQLARVARYGERRHVAVGEVLYRIEETPNITLHPHTELVALGGDDRLRNVTWRGPKGTETHPIAHVFLMIGAQPNSAWLGDRVAARSARAGRVSGERCSNPTSTRRIRGREARNMSLSMAPLLMHSEQVPA
jgi:hypothetical protein